MPEFRFRRKKQQNRRKTVHNPEETAKQIEAAKTVEPSKPQKRNSIGTVKQPSPKAGVSELEVDVASVPKADRSSLVQEREKFFELLRTKYPEQASSLEKMTNGDEKTNGHDVDMFDRPMEFEDSNGIFKTTSASELPSYRAEERTIASSFNECLFLRYGKSVRHCPMPSPITLSTVKSLYRNLFDLGDDLLENPDSLIFVRERSSREWKKLEGIGMVLDHCTLLLLEPGHTLNHTPSPPADSDINTPLDLSAANTQNSSQGSQPHVHTSGVGSGSHSSADDKEATPTTGQGRKRNGLWKAGRSKDVEDLTRVPDNLPVHKTHSLISPLSLTSSTSGVYSEPTVDTKKVSEKTRFLQNRISSMKSEFKKLRSDHVTKMSEFSLTMNQTSNQITAALRAFSKVGGVGSGGEEFRRERIELYSEEESYQKLSNETLGELKLLETAVEDMRVDVVDRRCGVEEQEVDSLLHAVSTVTKAVNEMQTHYAPLEAKIKRVMESELQTVIKEEKYIQGEGLRVTEAVDTCTKLEQTLGVLMQFATVQSHRTPLVPYYYSATKPDREALLENIQAVIPNHAHRVECLKRAETIFKKKKALHSPLNAKLKEFEAQLRIQRDHLRHIEVSTIEKRHQMKLQANFMEERYKMEKEIAKELETERILALQKREQRKKQMEELWKWQQRAKMDNEKTRQKQSIQRVMQGVGSLSGSQKSIPSSEGSGSHIRSSSDDQTTLTPHISLSQTSDPAPPPQMPPSKGKRFRKKDHLQPWQRKSIGYVGEFSELFQTIADEAQTSKQVSHPLTNTTKPTNQYPSSNQNAASKSHDLQLSNQAKLSKPNEQSSNQISAPPMVKATLGPKIEVKEFTGDSRQQPFQTTPPFKHPSKQSSSQSRPTKTVGQIRATSTNKHGTIPSRYLQYEYGSQPDTDSLSSYPSKRGYKSSINSLSQPSSDDAPGSAAVRSHMQPMLAAYQPDAQQKRATIGSTRQRGGAERPPQMKRSNSDDSIYDSSTLERRKKQGLGGTPYKVKQQGDISPSGNRRWAMNMLNKDTLPVEHRQVQFGNRQGNRGRLRNSSASSGSSGDRQSAKVMGGQQRYQHHVPKGRPEVPPQKHAPNCPTHGHLHNPPLRVTRSAQVPSDSPLTSYPRHLASATHTFQMRSASNGMPMQHQHKRGRGTHYPGHMTSGGGHVTKRRDVEDHVGSLV